MEQREKSISLAFEDTLKHATRDQLVTTLCVVAENIARISGGDLDDKERSLLSKEIVCGLIGRNGGGTNASPVHGPQNEVLGSILATFGTCRALIETDDERRLRLIRQMLNLSC